MKKFIINLLVFSTVFGLIITLLGFKLHNGAKFIGAYYEDRWNEFYSIDETKNVNIIFLGSSHCYRSFIPSVFDSINNISSFNLGSSSQTPQTSYFVLKEALRYKKVDKVILEVYSGSISTFDNFANALLNFDMIKSIDVKVPLMLTADNYTDMLEAILPAYRYNNYLSTLYKNIEVKDVSVSEDGLTMKYSDKGYVKTIAGSSFVFKSNFDSVIIDRTQFSDKNINSISMISEMCKENNIELILVTQPLNPNYYRSIKNYSVFHNTIDSIAINNNIKYIDGNYHPEIGLTHKDFYDTGHMLYSGAVKFSTWFANELKDSEQ